MDDLILFAADAANPPTTEQRALWAIRDHIRTRWQRGRAAAEPARRQAVDLSEAAVFEAAGGAGPGEPMRRAAEQTARRLLAARDAAAKPYRDFERRLRQAERGLR